MLLSWAVKKLQHSSYCRLRQCKLTMEKRWNLFCYRLDYIFCIKANRLNRYLFNCSLCYFRLSAFTVQDRDLKKKIKTNNYIWITKLAREEKTKNKSWIREKIILILIWFEGKKLLWLLKSPIILSNLITNYIFKTILKIRF